MKQPTETKPKSLFHKTAGYTAAAVCAAILLTFSVFYFSAYANPYMRKNMADISDGWRYGVGAEEPVNEMSILRQADVPAGEALHIYRALNERYRDAALMLKSNHQRLRVFLDGAPLFESPYDPAVKDPGMGLHFIPLPDGYEGKLLHIEIVSPYAAYSGAPGYVYIGDIPSLQAFALFHRSLLHTLLMALCLAAGGFMMALALLRRNRGAAEWGDFCFGVFSVLWGFFISCEDDIARQVFNPLWLSRVSLGLSFSCPLPLMLYFYSRFSRRRKAFLPAVILMGAFVAASFGLQISGVMEFPEMLNVFNPLFVLCMAYMIALGFTEIKRGGRFMRFTVPWMALAFLIAMWEMIAFYTTRATQDESLYVLAMFSAIMVVWVYNVTAFLRERVREQRDLLELTFKNAALDRANQIKTEFLQDMSHEMKAPLTVIATGIDFADQEMKAEDGSLEEAGGALESIRAETQRLGRMIGGMTQLATLGEISGNRSRVDFAALLRDSAEAFRYALEQKGSALTVETAPGMPDVFVERDHLTQVAANLLSNALEHTKDGRVTVAAEFDEEYITVRVSDTGEGVPPGILPRVFERGVSGRDSTGYGLYLCKTVVEAHGGTIKMESEPGKGCAVTFTVPVYGGQEAGHRL